MTNTRPRFVQWKAYVDSSAPLGPRWVIITQSCYYSRYRSGLILDQIQDTDSGTCSTSTSEIIVLFSRDLKLYSKRKWQEKLWLAKDTGFLVDRSQLANVLIVAVNVNWILSVCCICVLCTLFAPVYPYVLGKKTEQLSHLPKFSDRAGIIAESMHLCSQPLSYMANTTKQFLGNAFLSLFFT